MNALDPILNKLAKLVYTDSGETKIRKGRVIAFDDTFVTFQTWKHTYAIPRAAIIELKTIEEGRGP